MGQNSQKRTVSVPARYLLLVIVAGDGYGLEPCSSVNGVKVLSFPLKKDDGEQGDF